MIDNSPYCAPNGLRCLTEYFAQQCAPGGTHWIDHICDDFERCWEGRCDPVICTPGEPATGCVFSAALGICNSAGTGWEPATLCDAGQTCFDGECISAKCPAGARACAGFVLVEECDPEVGWIIAEQCEPGGLCVDGACRTACDVSLELHSDRGCEFVTAPLGPEAEVLTVSVDAEFNDAIVTVEDPVTGEVLAGPVDIFPGTSEAIELPGAGSPGTGRTAGVVVRSDTPIAVHQGGPWPEPADSALIMPRSTLGSAYVIPGWPVQSRGTVASRPAVTVIGTEPGQTEILAVFRSRLAGGDEDTGIIDLARHLPVTLTVEFGQALRLTPPDAVGDDMTGSWLEGSQPFAVMVSHDCARVPDGVGQCGRLVEQVLPVSALGDHVVAVPFTKRADSQFDVWQIIAADEDVIVTTQPPQPGYEVITLSRGGHVTLSGSKPFEIQATGRILVTQSIVGGDFPEHADDCDGQGIGGPAVTQIPPTVALAKNVQVSTPAGFDGLYVDIAHTPGANVMVDGLPLSGLFQLIEGSLWIIQRIQLPAGTHRIEAAQRIRVVAYGYRCGGAFAVPAGVRTQPLGTDKLPYLPGLVTPVPKVADLDGDGVEDGDDNCPNVWNPTQVDADDDSVGDACAADLDGDGVPNTQDCWPTDPSNGPQAAERCDGVDNDCDGKTDEVDAVGCTRWFVDADSDGAGAAGFSLCLCKAAPPYVLEFGGDCNDGDPDIGPWSPELCDDLDNDCNGIADDGCDDDGDGYCDATLALIGNPIACPSGGGDCIDESASVHPGKDELEANWVDDDCDGLTDDEVEADKPPDCTGLPCTGPTKQALLCAMDVCFGPDIVKAIDLESPTGSDTTNMVLAIPQLGDPTNGLAPRAGKSYLMLSTGVAGSSNHNISVGGTKNPTDPYPTFKNHKMFDALDLVLTFTPPDGATGFQVDTLFLSADYPEGVGTGASDKFYILVEANGITDPPVNFAGCQGNFADLASTGQCFISVNSEFGESCPNPPTNLSGSGYECGLGGPADGGSTGWLRTQAPIPATDKLVLRFHIHDTGNGQVDSAVLLDNFRWLSKPVISTTVKLPIQPEN